MWEGGPALVQTVDFFTPIVDDPYVYGQIAAANSLSDVYAMGGRPVTALAIAGVPKDVLEPDVIKAIFRGGFDKLREAGVALLGGHTVQDPELKFGYAVTGAIDPSRVWSNAGAMPGDVLILTKPLGTGIVGTAIKNRRAPDDVVEFAVASMRTLNKVAAETVTAVPGVHACTDITGFGLIGHGSEMAAASRVTLRIDAVEIAVLRGVLEISRRNRSGGMVTNKRHFGAGVEMKSSVPGELQDVMYDPQTSGGLLLAFAPESADRALGVLQAAGVAAVRIGEVGAFSAHKVSIR